LDQLVDMFPQYERQDLLTALRTRGSAEAVAESILLGVFTGVPRGMGAR
jgi:CUE domain